MTIGIVADLAGYHLRRAYAVVAADFQRALAGAEMRQVLFAILSVVAANPGISQGTVGRVLGIQRANIVSLINELVDGGLIDRHVDALLVDLSSAGRRTLAELLGPIEARER